MKGELSWRLSQWYRQFHSEAFSPVFVDKAGLFVVKLNMVLQKVVIDDFYIILDMNDYFICFLFYG